MSKKQYFKGIALTIAVVAIDHGQLLLLTTAAVETKQKQHIFFGAVPHPLCRAETVRLTGAETVAVAVVAVVVGRVVVFVAVAVVAVVAVAVAAAVVRLAAAETVAAAG